jgi:pimeloyl-ACP methyl ester carboxylesterase
VSAPGAAGQGRSIPTVRVFEAIKKHIPNSTLAFVDAGHFPPLESPDETTEEIAAFLAK